MKVYLTGFMGTGKSEVGKILARKLGWAYVDTDAAVERRAKKPVARIFREDGERAFRRLERAEIARVSRRLRTVAALGGGALLDPENKKRVRNGVCVRLTCAEPELWRRLKPELSRRPLLAGGRPALKRLLRRRRGAYAGADFLVSTTRRGPAETARQIIRRLKARS